MKLYRLSQIYKSKKSKPDPQVIGITGGIASGKTTVLNELRKFTSAIIEADKISHKIILKSTPAYKKIVHEFGKKILIEKTGQITRKKLGKIIFENPEKRNLLEKITHPYIIKEIENKIMQFKKKNYELIVLDAPLLFEAGIENLVDRIIVVWIPKYLQIKRLIKRDKITKIEAIHRINSQMSFLKKRKLADFVINNSLKYSSVKNQIKNFLLNIDK